jgi:predicted nucleic acid-binding protein
MAVVLDASLLVAVVSGDPRADEVSARSMHRVDSIRGRQRADAAGAAGAMPEDRVGPAWQAVQELPVTYHPLLDGPLVVSLARRLERHSAYDAAYLTLAKELNGICWTLDGRLVRNAARLDLPVSLAVP